MIAAAAQNHALTILYFDNYMMRHLKSSIINIKYFSGLITSAGSRRMAGILRVCCLVAVQRQVDLLVINN
jgi:hypothetical protein